MKLIEKNGYYFLTGMFWQIPDEGKRAVNMSKLAKETKFDMYCRTKKIKPTFGLCAKTYLNGYKRVASLAQYIVECSNVSDTTADCIICFKFKDVGEKDETGSVLEQAQYGYVVIMNGTICPDDGEYVSDKSMLRISILRKLKKHNINILHLPFDVAVELLNIYELLSVSFDDDETLLSVIHNSSYRNIEPLIQLITSNDDLMQKYSILLNNRKMTRFSLADSTLSEVELENKARKSQNKLTGDIEFGMYRHDTEYSEKSSEVRMIRQLIKENKFINKMADTRQSTDDLMIIAENIYTFAFDSDEIYWKNPKLKVNYTKSLIKSLSPMRSNTMKYSIFILAFAGVLFFGQWFTSTPKQVIDNNIAEEAPAGPIAVVPIDLINTCIVKNDKYFAEGLFNLTQLKCNSKGITLTFLANDDATLTDFIKFTGGNKAAVLNGKIGTITKAMNLMPGVVQPLARDLIISKLQSAALQYSLNITLPLDNKTRSFTVISKLSPIYLLNSGVFTNVKLMDISMSLDQQTGSYNWTIQGEI